MTNETKVAILTARKNLLNERDPMGNINIIRKINRLIRKYQKKDAWYKMREWLKKIFCFHKWQHVETHTIHIEKTYPPYFMTTYKCSKCGKTKSQYEDS